METQLDHERLEPENTSLQKEEKSSELEPKTKHPCFSVQAVFFFAGAFFCEDCVAKM